MDYTPQATATASFDWSGLGDIMYRRLCGLVGRCVDTTRNSTER